MPIANRLSAVLASAAAIAMSAAPAYSADIAVPKTVHAHAAGWNSEAVNAENHGYRRYRRDRGVDAGDVIAGVLIIGGIAAVASAASRNARDRDERYRTGPYRDRPYDYRERRGDSRYSNSRYSDSGGIDRAVDMCVREIERDVRVRDVDEVDRDGSGWRVSGTLFDGAGFTCRIGSDGRIENVDYANRAYRGASSAPLDDRQYGDDVYARARADTAGIGYQPSWQNDQDGPVANGTPAYPTPAYPGGPIDGDVYSGEDG